MPVCQSAAEQGVRLRLNALISVDDPFAAHAFAGQLLCGGCAASAKEIANELIRLLRDFLDDTLAAQTTGMSEHLRDSERCLNACNAALHGRCESLGLGLQSASAAVLQGLWRL